MIARGALADGLGLTANLQPGTLTLTFRPTLGVASGEEAVLAYDRAGRLWSAFWSGTTYRRGYNGRVLAKRTVSGQRQCRWLSGEEADALIAWAAASMQSLGEGVQWPETPPHLQAELDEAIVRAAGFTPQASAQDAQRFHSLYKPIGILPPDQYLALVLQLTEGCSFNTCTFCSFYRDRPFRIKSPDEFRSHIVAVLAYLGQARPMHKSIFLADANALVAPQQRLIELFDTLHQTDAGLSAAPACAFLDGFSGARKSAQDYAELARRGLKRVYIGMESGHDPLLQFLNKPGGSADAIAAARALKAGGVNVGLIVLLGAGGAHFNDRHIRDTVQAINAIGLSTGDLVYFSELIEQPDQSYGVIAARENIAPLSPDQVHTQRHAIQAGLRFAGVPPKLSTYDIREFVY